MLRLTPQANIFDKIEYPYRIRREKIPGGQGGFLLQAFDPKTYGFVNILMYRELLKIVVFCDHFT